MKRKYFSAFVVCMIWGAVFSRPLLAEGKVGFIDVQRLVNESKMGIAAKQNIEKLREEKEAVLASKRKEIDALKAHIDKEESQMSAREKQDKTERLKTLYKDYQKLANEAKEDILKQDRELVSVILQKADGILKEIAKKEHFSIILKDPNAIGYLAPEFDITGLVLKELNLNN